MKVFITGGTGTLGRELINELSKRQICYIAPSHSELDICNEKDVFSYIKGECPDVIIHCASWTNLDAAEKDENKKIVYNINPIGTKNLVFAAKEINSKFVYISTSSIFSDENEITMDTNYDPINYYGLTKLIGEEFVKTNLTNYFIIRTHWLFGKYGNNFVKTVIEKSKEDKLLLMVHDTVARPTCAKDLSIFICDLINTVNFGLYNITNEGPFVSYYEYAKIIFNILNKNTCKIIPVSSKDFKVIAKRPHKILLTNCANTNYKIIMPNWIDSLKDFIFDYESKNE